MLLHTNAVSKKSAPCEWACRVDSKDTNDPPFGAISRRQAIYKGALARTTRARNTNDWRPTGKWEQLAYQISTATVLNRGDRLCQGAAIAGH